MKRQRNTTQMKEQTRNTEVQINKGEMGKLPEYQQDKPISYYPPFLADASH